MKYCQIMPYGGEKKWIILGLREFEITNWLIILSNKPKDIQNTKESSVQSENNETKNFWDDAIKIVEELKQTEAELPVEKRRRIDLLEPVDSENFYEVLSYFRSLLYFIKSKGYRIIIHLSSGLMIWRMALLYSALEFKENVEKLYLFNKKDGSVYDLWLFQDLSSSERRIIDILARLGSGSITAVQQEFIKQHKRGNLSYVLKVSRKLIDMGLLKESKVGKNRIIELTPLGRSLISGGGYLDLIKKELEKV